jgi:hypothetical protein
MKAKTKQKWSDFFRSIVSNIVSNILWVIPFPLSFLVKFLMKLNFTWTLIIFLFLICIVLSISLYKCTHKSRNIYEWERNGVIYQFFKPFKINNPIRKRCGTCKTILTGSDNSEHCSKCNFDYNYHFADVVFDPNGPEKIINNNFSTKDYMYDREVKALIESKWYLKDTKDFKRVK